MIFVLTHLDIFTVNWSINLLDVQKNTNLNDMNDRRIDICRRICTLNKQNLNVKNHNIESEKIMVKIAQICREIQNQINLLRIPEGEELTQIGLILKQTEKDEWWLLFCTKIKLRNLEKRDDGEDFHLGDEDEMDGVYDPEALARIQRMKRSIQEGNHDYEETIYIQQKKDPGQPKEIPIFGQRIGYKVCRRCSDICKPQLFS